MQLGYDNELDKQATALRTRKSNILDETVVHLNVIAELQRIRITEAKGSIEETIRWQPYPYGWGYDWINHRRVNVPKMKVEQLRKWEFGLNFYARLGAWTETLQRDTGGSTNDEKDAISVAELAVKLELVTGTRLPQKMATTRREQSSDFELADPR